MKAVDVKPIFTYKNSFLLKCLRQLAKDLQGTPTKADIDACSYCPSTWVYYSRFGSINTAIIRAGLKPNRITKKEAFC